MSANISWITDLLATGGDLSMDPSLAADQVLDIASQNVTLIIDTREEASDEDIWEEVGIEYLWLPTDDKEGHHIPSSLFDKAVREAMFYMDMKEKVFVHCHMGVNRGPSVAYAILLAYDHDPVKAFDLIREKRPQAAVLYAPDALEAELKRRDFHHPVERTRLELRMKNAWTDEERARIEHVIREHHARDDDEWERNVKAGIMGLISGLW